MCVHVSLGMCVHVSFFFLLLLIEHILILSLPLYSQVAGKKYIRLYPASLSEELYPYTETMLKNSSQVSPFLNSI